MDILVGFRFHPTDEEIIFLLQEKRREPDFSLPAISEANIYGFEPPELRGLSRIQSDEKWCSFFCAPNYINTDTKRVTRATKTGYWKLTGEKRKIKAKTSNEEIGSKRILVFYERHPGSREIKTNWVMHQFSVKDDPLYKKDFVVCRVKWKVDKKRRISMNIEGQRQKKLRISTDGEGQPSHHKAFENVPSNCCDSNPRDDIVAENLLHVDAQNLTKSNALNDCSGFDQSSFSLSGSPVNVEGGSSSSSVSNNHYDLLLSPFGNEWEDNSMNFMNSQVVVWDEHSFLVTSIQQSPLQDFVV